MELDRQHVETLLVLLREMSMSLKAIQKDLNNMAIWQAAVMHS